MIATTAPTACVEQADAERPSRYTAIALEGVPRERWSVGEQERASIELVDDRVRLSSAGHVDGRPSGPDRQTGRDEHRSGADPRARSRRRENAPYAAATSKRIDRRFDTPLDDFGARPPVKNRYSRVTARIGRRSLARSCAHCDRFGR